MKEKKWMAMGAAAVMIAALSVQAFGAAATLESAQKTAKEYLPTDSVSWKQEENPVKFELEYYSESRKETYDIDIDKASGKMLKFESELVDDRGGTSVTVTEESAKKKVTEEFPKAEIVSARLEYDDGLQEYKIRFKTDSCTGEYKVHPTSGAVLSRDIQFVDNTGSGKAVTMEEAKKLAQAKAPGATLWEIKEEYEDGRQVYEGELRQGNIEYEFEIDAATGSFLDWNADYDD